MFLLFQEKFTTRHELALLRVSALSGLVMFGGMSSLFYTQMTGILSVSTQLSDRGHVICRTRTVMSFYSCVVAFRTSAEVSVLTAVPRFASRGSRLIGGFIYVSSLNINTTN